MAGSGFSRAALALIATAGIPLTAYAAAEPAAKNAEYYTKKVCRTARPIGTRLGGVRRCRSEAEWEELKREQRDVVNKMQTLKPTNSG